MTGHTLYSCPTEKTLLYGVLGYDVRAKTSYFKVTLPLNNPTYGTS